GKRSCNVRSVLRRRTRWRPFLARLLRGPGTTLSAEQGLPLGGRAATRGGKGPGLDHDMALSLSSPGPFSGLSRTVPQQLVAAVEAGCWLLGVAVQGLSRTIPLHLTGASAVSLEARSLPRPRQVSLATMKPWGCQVSWATFFLLFFREQREANEA